MKKGWQWIVLLFTTVSAFTLYFTEWLTVHGVAAKVVSFANLLLFVLTMAGYWMYAKSANAKGKMVLLNIYGSFMLKFFTVAIAVLIYVVMAKQINRPALYIGMALYFLYSAISVRNMLSLQKKSGDAERKSTV